MATMCGGEGRALRSLATVAVKNPYLDLTAEFNVGRLRVLLSSRQAVVFHRLAIRSKDVPFAPREIRERTT